MVGVAFTSTQASGVVTTFVTILDVRWKPMVSADVQVGYFLDEATYLAGGTPVFCQYVPLDVTQIVTTGNIPAQIIAQLIAPSGILPGATPVS